MMKNLDRDWLTEYPRKIVRDLARLAQAQNVTLYVSGGAVRDWVLGKPSHDLDITVADQAFEHARFLARSLEGAFVPLDEQEGVARVVWRDTVIDFSRFRDGATSIAGDLVKRDFTINALAVLFDPAAPGLLRPYEIIDPTGGLADIAGKKIRATSEEAFLHDPLRLLRAYRFLAALDFTLEENTARAIGRLKTHIRQAAPERVLAELERIMASSRAAAAFGQMARSGLLLELLPELAAGQGVVQPSSHHLDVFDHSLKTLAWMEKLQQAPERYFPEHGKDMLAYLGEPKRAIFLKWAALFHDLGKPCAYALRHDRITFYNHDRMGAQAFTALARRLRMSREATERIACFVSWHMWPFHLNNVRLKSGISARACLRLVKAVGDDLPGLFLLAMADSLAGQGPGKPEQMEESLALLYGEMRRAYLETIKPVLDNPLLLNGHDLRKIFGLAPGPIFGKILAGLEKAQVAGEVRTRKEAARWVESFLRATCRKDKNV